MVEKVLNILYLLSGPVIAIVSIVALKQLSIAKIQIEVARESMQISSRRDAAVFTAKQCEIFASEIIEQHIEIAKKFEAKKITEYVLPNNKKNIFEADYGKWFKQNKDKLDKDGVDLINLVAKLLNKLEAFSIYFTHGICDKKIAYLPIATSFIRIIEYYSPLICLLRDDNRGYSNILKLYESWKADTEKEELELKKEQLEKQIAETIEQASCIIEIPMNPIGTRKIK